MDQEDFLLRPSDEAHTAALRTCRWIKPVMLAAFMMLALVANTGWTRRGHRPASKNPPAIRLGVRLFMDDRFSTPKGDLRASCSTCHLLDEDPQGPRAHADFLARSWIPWRMQDPRRNELRNSPTILDAAKMPRLHFDGEFGSIEELVKGTLLGRTMGWLPGEQAQALQHVADVIMKDTGQGPGAEGSYRDQFKQAYGIDLKKLTPDEIINWVARAIGDYMRTLHTERTSPYDQFIRINGLETEPARGEDVKAFARRLLERIARLESQGRLNLAKDFDAQALTGLKTFFRATGAAATGNCVTCHAPPLFTDLSFHNLGISQREYDEVHGAGSFAALPIPDAAQAIRPSAQFRETPAKAKPGAADLGYWNFANLTSSPLRRAGENDDQFLRRMIGRFKTPTLRDLAYSHPYMHTGAYATLESALSELMRLSEMARAGGVRAADEELSGIRITEAEIPPLAAFLNTLNDDLKRAHRPLD